LFKIENPVLFFGCQKRPRAKQNSHGSRRQGLRDVLLPMASVSRGRDIAGPTPRAQGPSSINDDEQGTRTQARRDCVREVGDSAPELRFVRHRRVHPKDVSHCQTRDALGIGPRFFRFGMRSWRTCAYCTRAQAQDIMSVTVGAGLNSSGPQAHRT
jgi:hypothetical protein